MFWLFPALLTMLFVSMRDIYSKHSIKHVDEYIIALSTSLFTLPFLLPLLFFIEIPALEPTFFAILLSSGTLYGMGYIFFAKALKHSDISVAAPLQAFAPAFLLVTSPLMIGEVPSFVGAAGICFIVVGSYLLNIKERHLGYLAPFKALLRDAGPRYMLLAAFLFSINANLDKIGYQQSSILLWVIAGNAASAAFLALVAFFKSKNPLHQLQTYKKKLLLLGAFHAGNSFFHITAISATLVAYVVSIKRLSILVSVLAGHYVFKENNVKDRFLGAAIMVLGVILIAFS